MEEFLRHLDLSLLSDQDVALCDRKITENEIKIAMNSMKKDKSPGSDGLPVEFYITFWEDIKSILLDNYVQSFESEPYQTHCGYQLHHSSLKKAMHKIFQPSH